MSHILLMKLLFIYKEKIITSKSIIDNGDVPLKKIFLLYIGFNNSYNFLSLSSNVHSS